MVTSNSIAIKLQVLVYDNEGAGKRCSECVLLSVSNTSVITFADVEIAILGSSIFNHRWKLTGVRQDFCSPHVFLKCELQRTLIFILSSSLFFSSLPPPPQFYHVHVFNIYFITIKCASP